MALTYTCQEGLPARGRDGLKKLRCSQEPACRNSRLRCPVRLASLRGKALHDEKARWSRLHSSRLEEKIPLSVTMNAPLLWKAYECPPPFSLRPELAVPQHFPSPKNLNKNLNDLDDNEELPTHGGRRAANSTSCIVLKNQVYHELQHTECTTSCSCGPFYTSDIDGDPELDFRNFRAFLGAYLAH